MSSDGPIVKVPVPSIDHWSSPCVQSESRSVLGLENPEIVLKGQIYISKPPKHLSSLPSRYSHLLLHGDFSKTHGWGRFA